jgi:hypothetical protein
MASVFVMSSPASFCYPAMFHNDDLFFTPMIPEYSEKMALLYPRSIHLPPQK